MRQYIVLVPYPRICWVRVEAKNKKVLVREVEKGRFPYRLYWLSKNRSFKFYVVPCTSAMKEDFTKFLDEELRRVNGLPPDGEYIKPSKNR